MITFYMVVREPQEGFNNTPQIMHGSIDSAKQEAERLCKKHKCKFFVVKCDPVLFCRIPETPVEWSVL
jgi:hypothetical protein